MDNSEKVRVYLGCDLRFVNRVVYAIDQDDNIIEIYGDIQYMCGDIPVQWFIVNHSPNWLLNFASCSISITNTGSPFFVNLRISPGDAISSFSVIEIRADIVSKLSKK